REPPTFPTRRSSDLSWTSSRALPALFLLLLLEQLLPLGLVEEAEGGHHAGRLEQHALVVDMRLRQVDVRHVHDAVEPLHPIEERSEEHTSELQSLAY